MDWSGLRKWKVLNHLTDEELGKIAYLQLYGGHDRSSDLGLSAIFVTCDDEVYGTGFNSMVGNGTSYFPIDKDQDDSLEKFVKLDALSGLGITKIVVGSTFGAALSNSGGVFVWGLIGDTMIKVNDEDIVMYVAYQPNKGCVSCLSYDYTQELIGLTSISKCTVYCSKYPSYTMKSPPPPGITVRRFFKFSVPVSCPKCLKITSSRDLNGSSFHFCIKCNMMLEVTSGLQLSRPSDECTTPQKLVVSESLRISDIYCGSAFLVIETVSIRLVLWGCMFDGTMYKGCIFNPDNVRIKSVSCGGSHIAVISSRGELYTCGQGDKGQLGYPWTSDMGHITLRKVPLKGSVVKVCCGYSSTACLMSNGSIVCFGSNMKKLSSGFVSLSCSDSDFLDAPSDIMESTRFIDITCAPLTNIFCAKTEDLLVFIWGKETGLHHELLLDVSELDEALSNLPYTYYKKVSQSRKRDIPFSLCPITQEFGTLFGKELFSDLTLKLADGDFPVHRVILLLNSSYFKEVLSNKPTSDALDMSPYNPTSYKCLLKYFYQLPMEDLGCEDLFDLYSIATSYKEKDLADTTFNKLKAMLNEDTVLKLLNKAKSTNADEILKECELFLSSPELKNELLHFVSQDIEKTVALLRMKTGE